MHDERVHIEHDASILVVEESNQFVLFLSSILENRNYHIFSVRDGIQALDAAQTHMPDVIVLDIGLPGIDGFALCEHLKASPSIADIPVIFISACDEAGDRVKAFSAGGVDYINRPLHREEVLARITTHLALRTSQRQIQAQQARLEQEIARRKKAEESLHTSQALFDAFLNHAPAYAFVTSLDGRILMVNRQLASVFGYDPDHMVDRFQWDLFPSESVARWQQEDQWILSAGRPLVVEEDVSLNGDDVYTYLTIKFPLYDKQGVIYAIGGMATDITERKRMEKALRLSERRYRLITDLITDYVYSFQVEPDGTFVPEWGFEGLPQLTGYRVDEIDRAGWDHIIHPDDRQLLQHHIARSLEGQSIVMELRIITRAGEVCWVRYHAYPEWNAQQGRVVRIYGAVQHITERKRVEMDLHALNTDLEHRVQRHTMQLKVANQTLRQEINERKRTEDALRQSEARFRTLVETSTAAIFMLDMNLRLCYANPAAEVVTGYAREMLLQMAWSDLLHPDFHALVQEHVAIAGEGTVVPAHYEVQLVTRDLQECWVTLSQASVIYDGHPALLLTAFDITERRHVEQALHVANTQLADANAALRRNRDLLHALFDGLEDGFLLLNKMDQVQTANRASAHLLETTPDDLVNRHWSDLSAQFDRESTWTLPLVSPSSGQRSSQRVRYRRANGTMAVFDLAIITITSEMGMVEQVIVHLMDVTELVQLQARVIEHERFIASGHLAASVAHEINTPLQAIQSFLELVTVATEVDQATFLAHALAETQRVGRIVRQLLDLYRPTAMHTRPVDVNALIERLLILLGKHTREQAITITCTLEKDVPAIWGRADELMQILLNLLINAIEAMPNGGDVYIVTDWTDHAPPLADECTNASGRSGCMMITITDTGSGVHPDVLPFIFNPFFTTKEHGTGLGLSISAELIQHMDGTLTMDSQVGHGSTVTITLPYTPRTEPAGTDPIYTLRQPVISSHHEESP